MPWDCKSCNATVDMDDETTCPECGNSKMAWTMVANSTRTFQITSKKKVKYLKGVGEDAIPQEGAGLDVVEVENIEVARAVSKTAARQLALAKALPPPEQILVIRLYPPPDGDLTVSLTPEYETQEPEEQTYPFEGEPELDEEGATDRRFVFVYGPKPLPEEVAFPGLEVVDISEESTQGFAPKIRARALTRRKKILPVERGLQPFVLSL